MEIVLSLLLIILPIFLIGLMIWKISKDNRESEEFKSQFFKNFNANISSNSNR